MGGLHMEMACIQVGAPWALRREGNFNLSATLIPTLLDIIIVTQLISFKGQCLLSLEALLITPNMGGGFDPLVHICSGTHHATWGQCCWHQSEALW